MIDEHFFPDAAYSSLLQRAVEDAREDQERGLDLDDDGLCERSERRAREAGLPEPDYVEQSATATGAWRRLLSKFGHRVDVVVALPPDRGAEAYCFAYVAALLTGRGPHHRNSGSSAGGSGRDHASSPGTGSP